MSVPRHPENVKRNPPPSPRPTSPHVGSILPDNRPAHPATRPTTTAGRLGAGSNGIPDWVQVTASAGCTTPRSHAERAVTQLGVLCARRVNAATPASPCRTSSTTRGRSENQRRRIVAVVSIDTDSAILSPGTPSVTSRLRQNAQRGPERSGRAVMAPGGDDPIPGGERRPVDRGGQRAGWLTAEDGSDGSFGLPANLAGCISCVCRVTETQGYGRASQTSPSPGFTRACPQRGSLNILEDEPSVEMLLREAGAEMRIRLAGLRQTLRRRPRSESVPPQFTTRDGIDVVFRKVPAEHAISTWRNLSNDARATEDGPSSSLTVGCPDTTLSRE